VNFILEKQVLNVEANPYKTPTFASQKNGENPALRTEESYRSGRSNRHTVKGPRHAPAQKNRSNST